MKQPPPIPVDDALALGRDLLGMVLNKPLSEGSLMRDSFEYAAEATGLTFQEVQAALESLVADSTPQSTAANWSMWYLHYCRTHGGQRPPPASELPDG